MSEFRSVASVDGVVTPVAEARVPVLDRGFLYGDSIYEVFRTYDGVPLFFDEHWTRFENSGRLISLEIGFSREAVFEAIRAAVAASGAPELRKDVYVRYVVTRGEGPLDLLPSTSAPQRLVIIVKEVPQWPEVLYTRGVRLAVVPVRRNPSTALDPNIKGGNYLNNVLGVLEADRQGANDCLMLNESGLVTEASNSNVFAVIDGDLVTPSQIAANLKGLTKAAVHDACAAAGIKTTEIAITAADLSRATECFLTSATREVMPVESVRFEDSTSRVFPEGGGPLTRRVAGIYKEYVADYVDRHRHLDLFTG